MKVTAERVAKRLIEIATEHGVPNGAGVDEIAGAQHRLLVVRLLQWDLAQINALLGRAGFKASYQAAAGGVGARIELEAVEPAGGTG